MTGATGSAASDRTVPPGRLVALLVAVASFSIAMLSLLFLLWRYVPMQAAFFEGLGARLPVLSRLVIVASMWTVRLLPLLVLLCVPALAVIAVAGLVVTLRADNRRRMVEVATALVSGMALLGLIACALVVYSMHLPLELAGAHP